MLNIDLELYRIFYTVAKYKNISKATEELYISQPAITQRINNLEKQLNIKLFYRRPDGMQLTLEGKELYNYVKDSIEAMNNVENKFNRYLQKNRSNNIKIKTTNQIDNLILCNTIVKFSKKYPKIGIDLDIGTEKEAVNEILNGQVDIITIRDIVKTKNKNLQIVATKKLTPCLYTSRNYLEKHDKKMDLLNSAEQYNFILPKQDTLERREFDKFCREHHLNIQYKYETQSINIRKYFVLSGLGIAVGFKEYIQEELKKNIFVEIPLEGGLTECNINWVTLNNERKKNEILKLIEIVKEE
mgnify:CR=1 FL=1